MKIDAKALEAVAKAIWDNHRQKYPKDSLIQGEFGADEDSLGFLYHRIRGYAQAAITAYLSAIEEAGFVVVPRQLMWDVVATIEEKLVRDAIEEALSAIAAKDAT